tara:strand:+ start:178 stop:726 length:549 start_codon:yes stop_codon:yes gene_type:complete
MNLEEAIVVINPELDQNIVQGILDYTDYIAKEKMKTVGGLTEDVRNVFGYSLDKEKISNIIFFKHIQNVITQNYMFYKIKFPQTITNKINQIDLLKYQVGGKYEIHVDHGYSTPRSLTCIINLNEDYEGGDFVFYHQNGKDEIKRIKCKKGTIIFFPSNFLFPHRVEPITKGTRYSIVSWLL